MYERKRRKKEAVLLIPKAELDPVLKSMLLERYPRSGRYRDRWVGKTQCKQQEDVAKLRKQAILTHHNKARLSSTEQEQKLAEFLDQFNNQSHRSKPYSHDQNTGPRARKTISISRPSHLTCSRTPGSSDEASSSSSPVCGQSPNDRSPLDYSPHELSPLEQSPNSHCLLDPSANIKDEPVESYCEHTVVKQEPVDYTDHQSSTPLDTSQDSQASSSHQLDYGESGSSKASLTSNISIKQELRDVPLMITKPQKTMKKKQVVVPMPLIKQEPIEMEDLPPVPQIKEELLDSEEDLLEIKRNRVKKLRQVTVEPFTSDLMIKEEPLDLQDVEIKEEQLELDLLEFHPTPRAFGKNLAHRKPKFVYGKRINRTKAAPLNLNQDFEFDSAAQLSTPFSPPKSSWPVSKKGQDEVMSEEEEPEEEREMRQKVDQLMSEGTIDDADELYQLFTKTIKQCTDPTENVFNTVLTLFKERKEKGETCPATPEKRPVGEEGEEGEQGKSCLFPMSDHEIYNQEVAVVADISTPAEDFLPTIIKTEQVDELGIELTAPANDQFSDNFAQFTSRDTYTELVPAMAECTQTDASSSAPRSKDWKKVDGVDLYYDPANDKMFQPLGKGIKIEPGYQPMIFPPKKYTYPQPPKAHTYPQPPKAHTYPQPSKHPYTYPQPPKEHTYPQPPKEHTYPQSKERRPSAHSIYSKNSGEVTEAERLFDELIEEEQVPFVPQDPNQTSFIEPFTPSGVFSTQSLDDLIKAPLVPNEHCIKPKPSYAPMTFDNSENKPPVVLFSSKPEDGGQKQDPGWGSWKKPSNETFDQFQSSSEWGDNPSSWSPGHSDWEEPYFPSTAQQSSFEEHGKDSLDKSCGSDDDMAVRHPVTQRNVQTQFPYDNIYSEIEYSWPQTVYIKERQIYINHSFTQTPGPPLFPLSLAPGRFRRRRPVLVEPLPTIEPIGDTVTQLRTMRTSDSYSLLMERLRTCTDPSFDRFMNSQRQPTGLVSTFNQFACYSPQANIPELPLTVNKSYSDKSNSVGKRPGIVYKEVTPKPYNSHHSTTGLICWEYFVIFETWLDLKSFKLFAVLGSSIFLKSPFITHL